MPSSSPDPLPPADPRPVPLARSVTFTALRNQRFEQQTVQLRREHWARLVTGIVIFAVVVVWLAAVLVVVILQGSAVLHLDDKVLVALLVTTSLNVIGLLAAVVGYLFPKSPLVFGHHRVPVARGRPPGTG